MIRSRGLHRLRSAARVCDVAGDEFTGTAQPGQVSGHGLPRIGVDIRHHHRTSGPRKSPGNAPADTGARPGDQGHAILQHCHLRPSPDFRHHTAALPVCQPGPPQSRARHNLLYLAQRRHWLP